MKKNILYHLSLNLFCTKYVTPKATNESLIATLDEVMKIQTEGKEKRRAAEVELNRMEGELKQKLLEIH